VSWLEQNRGALFRKAFPPATDGVTPLRFYLRGAYTDGRLAEADLDFIDVPGRFFGRREGGDAESQPGQSDRFDNPNPSNAANPVADGLRARAVDQLSDHLAACDGIIMLFDPIRDLEDGDSHLFVVETLDRLFTQTKKERHLEDGFLPQHLSICITKFDDQRVADEAMSSADWAAVASGDRVRQETAENYFDALYRALRPGAFYIRNAIDSMFHSTKVKYYATSAVGFYLEPNRPLNHRDCQNVRDGGPNGELQVRGLLRPMNVLEPVRGMASTIKRGQPRAGMNYGQRYYN
jgi:hypothetical protein